MLIANESLVLGTLCDLNCKGSPKPQHAPWTQLIHKTSNREKAWWVKEYTLLLASWLFLISDLSVVKTPAWHVTVVLQDEITNQVRIFAVRLQITLKFNPSYYGYGFLTPAERIDLLLSQRLRIATLGPMITHNAWGTSAAKWQQIHATKHDSCRLPILLAELMIPPASPQTHWRGGFCLSRAALHESD